MQVKEISLDRYLEQTDNQLISGFICRDESPVGNQRADDRVEKFLKNDALVLMERNLVRTRLFFEKPQKMVGFYSLFNDSILITNKQVKGKLGVKGYGRMSHFPCIRLHYIGVDNRYRCLGFGEHMLIDAIERCLAIAADSGCALIIAESTGTATGFYEKYGFIHIGKNRELFIMALSIKSYAEAIQQAEEV